MRTAKPMLEETVLMQIREDIAREGNKLNKKLARSEPGHFNTRS